MWSELRQLKADIDYGTPPRDGPPVALQIDGVPVTVPAGSSVLLAATQAGRQVPKLCACDTLEPFGSCRVCRWFPSIRLGPRKSALGNLPEDESRFPVATELSYTKKQLQQ